jgi:hypothetical protein
MVKEYICYIHFCQFTAQRATNVALFGVQIRLNVWNSLVCRQHCKIMLGATVPTCGWGMHTDRQVNEYQTGRSCVWGKRELTLPNCNIQWLTSPHRHGNLKPQARASFAYYKLYDAVSTAQIIRHRLHHDRSIRKNCEGDILTPPPTLSLTPLILLVYITNSMHQRTSWKANSFSASPTRNWSHFMQPLSNKSATCPLQTSIHSTSPKHAVLWPILILSPHLLLRFRVVSSPHASSPCTSPLFHTCYVSRPPYSSWFDHSNDVWRGVKIMNIVTVQFPPLSCHLPLRCATHPQHVPPSMWESFTPI